jgi:hypothetical protein
MLARTATHGCQLARTAPGPSAEFPSEVMELNLPAEAVSTRERREERWFA